METLFLPIIILLKTILLGYHSVFGGFGVPLLLLSATTSFLIIPIERWGARVTQKEKALQKILAPQIANIKRESSGKVRHDRLASLYRRYAYHPIYALKSACGLLIQLPLLFSAYYMIENLAAIKGVPLVPFIGDLSRPDHILWGINLLPLVMTAFNVAALFSTPGFTRKDTVQGLVVAGLFLVLLYNSPSALLLYWTANNLFSFLKNVVRKRSEAFSRFISKKALLCAIGIVVVFVGFCMLQYVMFSPLSNDEGDNTTRSRKKIQRERIRLCCDVVYSFDPSNPCFLYADPTVSNLSLCEGSGLQLSDNEWGTFSVYVSPTPLNQSLTLNLTLDDDPETDLGNAVFTVRDSASGHSQTYTNWPSTIELGGLSLGTNTQLRIQVLSEECAKPVFLTSMFLRTGYSQAQVEEMFNAASAENSDYVWQDAVSSVSEGIENYYSSNRTLVIESNTQDPYIVFEKINLPKAETYAAHIQLTVPEATCFQFFYMTGRTAGFDAERSVLRDVWPGDNSLYLLLPGDFSGVFRIDPGMLEENRIYEIKAIEFRRVNLTQEEQNAL